MTSNRIAHHGASRPIRRRLARRLMLGLTTCLVLSALLVGGTGTGAAASSYDPSSDGYWWVEPGNQGETVD